MAALSLFSSRHGRPTRSFPSADRYWAPFKMACHPEQPDRLQNAAVGCIQRLVAFRLLKGQPAPPEGTPASPTQASKGVTVEEVVLNIAECFDGPATDDSLQLNILKVGHGGNRPDSRFLTFLVRLFSAS